MTAKELVSDLRTLGPQDANVIFTYIADHIYQLRLGNGARICDVMDCKILLYELAEAAHISEFSRTEPKASPPPQNRWRNHTCPDCDHVHEGREECAFYLGEGRFCHCPSKVTA